MLLVETSLLGQVGSVAMRSFCIASDSITSPRLMVLREGCGSNKYDSFFVRLSEFVAQRKCLPIDRIDDEPNFKPVAWLEMLMLLFGISFSSRIEGCTDVVRSPTSAFYCSLSFELLRCF